MKHTMGLASTNMTVENVMKQGGQPLSCLLDWLHQAVGGEAEEEVAGVEADEGGEDEGGDGQEPPAAWQGQS